MDKIIGQNHVLYPRVVNSSAVHSQYCCGNLGRQQQPGQREAATSLKRVGILKSYDCILKSYDCFLNSVPVLAL